MPPAPAIATVLSADAQATGRPVSTFPAASYAVATSWAVSPSRSSTEPGDTTTRATPASGARTRTIAVPVTPSTVARTIAVPAASALTSPPGPRVMTSESAVDHATPRPVSTLPAESRATASKSPVPPTFRTSESGTTSTRPTRGPGGATEVTRTIAEPLTPPTVAVMRAVPRAMAVTPPSAPTRATVLSADDQATARPLSGLPAES